MIRLHACIDVNEYVSRRLKIKKLPRVRVAPLKTQCVLYGLLPFVDLITITRKKLYKMDINTNKFIKRWPVNS